MQFNRKVMRRNWTQLRLGVEVSKSSSDTDAAGVVMGLGERINDVEEVDVDVCMMMIVANQNMSVLKMSLMQMQDGANKVVRNRQYDRPRGKRDVRL